MVEIVPSILSADFARLGEDIAKVERGGARMLHVDIMDGHFVPNLTLGPPVVKSIRKITALTLDLHLMISDPDTYAPIFIEAGADQVSVHYEAAIHLDRTIRLIQSHGARAGVVLNPATPVALLEDVVDILDYVLVMSVNPGFGGQAFLANSYEKIRQLNELRRRYNRSFRIEVDGGVDAQNIAQLAQAGANSFVAGTSIFHTADPAAATRNLKRLATDAVSLKT